MPRERSTALLLLEVAEGGLRVAAAELEIAQRGDRPHLAQAEAELAGQAERLGGVQAALLGPALPRLQPRQARQGGGSSVRWPVSRARPIAS